MLHSEETKETNAPQLDENPYIDPTLMKDLADFNVESNTEFISKHEIERETNISFPKTIQAPPESNEYKISTEDSNICKHLYNTYKSQIQEFDNFGDDVIYRFMAGYRHIKNYTERFKHTDELFCEYLKWRKNSDFDNILNKNQINNVPIDEYLKGCYVYGQDVYGHPIFFDEGLKYHTNSDLTVYTNAGDEGTDQLLGYFLRLLQKMKEATNKHYGLETMIKYDDDDDDEDCEENENKQIEGGKVGIIRHIVIFDLSNFDSFRVIKDIKFHEYFLRRFSLLFPEMIHKVYVINTPWIFKQIWKIVKGFLHRNTVQKTVILGSEYKKELFKQIHPDFIPKKFGGNGQWGIVEGSIPKNYPIQLL